MSAARDLLSELQSLGVELSANGDRLHVKAPAGVVTYALRERLTKAKPDLLQLLATNQPEHRHPPCIWHCLVDGKGMTIIDHSRLTFQQMESHLLGRFGVERITELRREERRT